MERIRTFLKSDLVQKEEISSSLTQDYIFDPKLIYICVSSHSHQNPCFLFKIFTTKECDSNLHVTRYFTFELCC
jgi:hypothetical protein